MLWLCTTTSNSCGGSNKASCPHVRSANAFICSDNILTVLPQRAQDVAQELVEQDHFCCHLLGK